MEPKIPEEKIVEPTVREVKILEPQVWKEKILEPKMGEKNSRGKNLEARIHEKKNSGAENS